MDVFSLVGRMTLDGTDKVNQQLSGLEKNVDKVQKGLKIAGAAFTAVGAAGLAMIQSTKAINAHLGVTALNLGITVKEMRDLTLATTNVTFPIDEVTASFDLLARAGVKDTEVLKATATAFDTLGDAIGMSASQVTDIMAPAMKTFRLSAEEMASKTDLITYMTRNSTSTLEDFNTMVGYTDQEMVDAGLSMEDMTAAMMYMADEGVLPGKVMLKEWNKAVTQSKKEGISMTEALGMTSEELERYKEGLAGATGLTQQLADIQNEQYTIIDKLKAKFSELTLGASGFLEPLEPMLAGMTALGPLMIGLSTSAGTAAIKWGLHTTALIAHKVASFASAVAIKAVTAAQWLWNAAMTANPIGLIIVGIGALIAAGILLWKNWDKVIDFFEKAWTNIKIFFLEGVQNILESLSTFTRFIPGLNKLVDSAKDKIAEMIEAEKIEEDVRAVERALEDVETALEDTAEIIAEHSEATDIDTIALEDNTEQLVLQREELEKELEARKTLLAHIEDTRRAYEYERSAAGRLRISVKDVQFAFFDLGGTQEELIGYSERLGDEVDNVNEWLKILNLTAEDVNFVLNEQTEAIDKTTEAYKRQAEAAAESAAQQAKIDPDFGAGKIEAGMSPYQIAFSRGYDWENLTPRQYEEVHGFQQGGLITEPTLLTRVGSSIPYGIMAEKRPEYISPGIPSFSINIAEMNVRNDRDIDLVAERIVSKIRLKTGVKV